MAVDPRKIESVRTRQREMFRKATDRRTYNLTLAEIAERAGLDDSSVSNYAGGVTTMSLVALDALIDVIPDELLSELLPGARMIIRKPEGLNHDEAAAGMQDYLAAKMAAHHPESPAGRDIADCEDETLRTKFVVVAGGRS